jgi:methionyl aminopeptidase
MTEKDYSGATTSKIGKNAKSSASQNKESQLINKKQDKKEITSEQSSAIDIESYKKAGEIAKKAREFAKTIIKKDMLLAEIAEKIESEILKLGGELAFPVNLSIDDIAAHYTPTLRDEKKAEGLLKVDMGVHIKGCIADLAFSLDLTPEKKYEKLIQASEEALKKALELVKNQKEQTKFNEIGKVIETEIKKRNLSPIVNLSGHSLEEFNIHAGLTLPNVDNGNTKTIGEGAFAIEPFATISSGSGSVYDGSGSNIYNMTGAGFVRDSFAREVLEFILENKKTLPFSQRELEKKFGSRAMIALANLKRAGAINEFPQLIEKSHSPVSQAEASFVISEGKVEIITE